MEFKFSEIIPFETVLDRLIAEAKADREKINTTGNYDVDTKRAVATVVTKLEEARMWRRQGENFYIRKMGNG